MKLMSILIAFLAAFLVSFCASTAHAENKKTVPNGTRIIQTDSVGNRQYHKDQYVVQNGKVYQTDSVGNIQYHKPSYTVVQPVGSKGKSK